MKTQLTNQRSLSLQQTLSAGASFAVLASILAPVLGLVSSSKISNKPNLIKISAAAMRYGQDYDDHIPILADGSWSGLSSFPYGYGQRQTRLWPLILLPYVKDIHVYQDPRRDDLNGIWSGPAKEMTDPGYKAMGNSYRNQNRFPCFGVNYVFLSPLHMDQGGTGRSPLGQETTAEGKSFAQAKDPSQTVFYTVTDRGRVQTGLKDSVGVVDTTRGFFVVNAPGMWGLNSDKYDEMIFWNGGACSGDWCGDVDPKTPGHQRGTDYFYREAILGGNNVAFLDGHVKFMTDEQLTAGTNYWQAGPRGAYGGGGAVITNKAAYLWDLDGTFDGLY